MPRITVNGVELCFQQVGYGPDVVFIHGLGTNRAFWYLPIARRLQPHFRITLYDLRGHGSSEIARSGYTPREMADDLHELLAVLQIRRATLVGHSYGGSVALSYAARHPKRVRKLVLSDVRINSLQPAQRLADSPHLSEFERAFVDEAPDGWQLEKDFGLRLLEEMAARRNRQAWNRAKARTQSGFVPFGNLSKDPRAVKKWSRLLHFSTLRDDARRRFHLDALAIARIRVPTLLVYGERSRCLQSGEALRRLIPRSNWVLLPDAGHFHPATHPASFLRILGGFLATGSSPVADTAFAAQGKSARGERLGAAAMDFEATEADDALIEGS